MNNHVFLIPDDFDPPAIFETPDFTFRKLTYFDAEMDYKAVMSSIEIIKKTRGGNWPDPSLTFVDDQIDLAWHQREFENRTSFAYMIVNPENTECLGCFYIYPPGFRSPLSKNASVDVSFWVSQAAYDKGLYRPVYKTLYKWLETAWPFKDTCYTNLELPHD